MPRQNIFITNSKSEIQKVHSSSTTDLTFGYANSKKGKKKSFIFWLSKEILFAYNKINLISSSYEK